jgi:hypothetical protein
VPVWHTSCRGSSCGTAALWGVQTRLSDGGAEDLAGVSLLRFGANGLVCRGRTRLLGCYVGRMVTTEQCDKVLLIANGSVRHSSSRQQNG